MFQFSVLCDRISLSQSCVLCSGCIVAFQVPGRADTHLPHGIRVFSRLDARGVDGAVDLMPYVEHHYSSIVAAHSQKRVVHRVEVEAHHLILFIGHLHGRRTQNAMVYTKEVIQT